MGLPARILRALRYSMRFAAVAAALIMWFGVSVAQGAKQEPCAPSLDQCPLEGCSSSDNVNAPYDPLLNIQKNHDDSPAATGTTEYTVSDMMDPKELAGVSVIAEVTWRVRNNDHTDWTVPNLEQLDILHEGAKVRITGDLLYDNVHWDMVHKGQRGSLWEIHPIRRIQVYVNRKWVDYGAGENSTLQLALSRTGLAHGAKASATNNPLTARWKPNWTASQRKRFISAFGDDKS